MNRAHSSSAILLLLHILVVLTPAGFAAVPALAGPGNEQDQAPADLAFPQEREVDGFRLIIHAPQIRTWANFEHFEAELAVEVSAPGDAAPRYGTASLSGETKVDLEHRLVRIDSPTMDDVIFVETVPAGFRDAVMKAVTRTELDVPLDLFLAYLADEVLAEPPPPGFNTEPPPIVVTDRPTLLLSVNGEPLQADVPETRLQLVVNANWPLYRVVGTKEAYYLLERDRWLTSTRLETGWKAAGSLPDDFSKLPDDPLYAAARSAVPFKAGSRPVPKVLFVTEPTELIVTDGKPRAELIEGTGGLAFVANTESLLFRLDGAWYYLVAGRWFITSRLDKGPWSYVPAVPEAFSLIPEGHPRAAVLASVPGTIEARMAALEALLPTKVSAARNDPPPVTVSYAGAPKFEPVAGASVSRAVNSGFDIIEHQGRYYLLYSGVWYDAPAPTGPWTATASVPAAIYQIPPSSPAYNVTQVTVVESTPSTVVYSYPPSYSSSVYVVYGVPYYGTGWYYPPYIRGPYYYPYPASYGYGSWYNPATGGYGSRSVWYGPYGGYSYNQGYNPTTARYGYVETAWDGDEWASYGETYNPRTGVGTETSRYYDEDKNRSEMKRTTYRGDEYVKTERHTDFDEGTSEVQRKTSQGGSSKTTRELSNGTLTSSTSGTTGDGRDFSISSEATRSGGSTSITGAQRSAEITTQRQNGSSVAKIEGSQGGQGVSASGQGPGRTTVGQSGSGDLYAGHNGNVYKKTDDGWQNYQNGSWKPVDTPDGAPNRAANAERSGAAAGTTAGIASATGPAQGSQPWRDTGGAANRASAQTRQTPSYGGQRPAGADYSRLNRDYRARQSGSRQFQQRSRSMRGLSGRAGGMARRR